MRRVMKLRHLEVGGQADMQDVAEAKLDVEILRKATAYFARGSR